ncbi:MAG: polysaccharide biosynthesis/export family protein [Desulfomonile tiedjei]|nr:polysaccharide biosynthesis/export family protein [Desulfomonile tiedjei]
MTLAATACLCALLLVPGCIGLIPSPFNPSPGPQKSPQLNDLAEAFDIVCRNYRLGPGDELTLLFLTEWNIPTGTYKLDTLDKISIKFILDPQLNEDVTIRPDGMITLQAIGEIQAAGLTPQELAKRIEQRFVEAKIFSKDESRGDLKNYRLVTVHVLNFYEKINKLVGGLTTLTGGSQTSFIVKPDGTIDLPLLKERILCAGHTVPDVERTVNRLYRNGTLEHVVASMKLSAARSRKFYVLGEVGSQGAFDITQPITILHALAMAGGPRPDTADLTSVILVSKDIHGKPIGRRVDLKRILDVGDMGQAILVKPYDVIFVPKTYIRDLRIFMDQYLSVVRDFVSLGDTLRPR